MLVLSIISFINLLFILQNIYLILFFISKLSYYKRTQQINILLINKENKNKLKEKRDKFLKVWIY